MSTQSDPPEGRGLGQAEVSALLDGWAAANFSVGIVLSDEQLVAVYEGRLQPRHADNAKSVVWPVDQETKTGTDTQWPGVVLDPRLFTGATFYPHSRVVELQHGALKTYVRRL